MCDRLEHSLCPFPTMSSEFKLRNLPLRAGELGVPRRGERPSGPHCDANDPTHLFRPSKPGWVAAMTPTPEAPGPMLSGIELRNLLLP